MIHHTSQSSQRHPIRSAMALFLAVGAMTSGASAQEAMTFTQGQAIGGGAQYQRFCAACHGAELEGTAAPALEGESFSSWFGQPVIDLHSYIHETMPADNPGSLSDPQVSTIIAFLGQRNGLEAGGDPLPTDPAGLEGLTFGTAAGEAEAEGAASSDESATAEGASADQ